MRYAFLDFSTRAARRCNCAEELRLNQALAPGVYLGVVPLVRDESGNARLEAEGRVLEWLVKMRRLPADRMLDRLIRQRAARESEIEELARRLADFTAKARRWISGARITGRSTAGCWRPTRPC